MSFLRVFLSKSTILAAVLAILLPVTCGCGSQEAERTEDPVEIEQERLKHVEMSQREMQESNN